jgi:hypothetical protein
MAGFSGDVCPPTANKRKKRPPVEALVEPLPGKVLGISEKTLEKSSFDPMSRLICNP